MTKLEELNITSTYIPTIIEIGMYVYFCSISGVEWLKFENGLLVEHSNSGNVHNMLKYKDKTFYEYIENET